MKKKKPLKTDEELAAALEEKNNNARDNEIPKCPKSWLYRDDDNEKKHEMRNDKRREYRSRRSRSRSHEKNRDYKVYFVMKNSVPGLATKRTKYFRINRSRIEFR